MLHPGTSSGAPYVLVPALGLQTSFRIFSSGKVNQLCAPRFHLHRDTSFEFRKIWGGINLWRGGALYIHSSSSWWVSPILRHFTLMGGERFWNQELDPGCLHWAVALRSSVPSWAVALEEHWPRRVQLSSRLYISDLDLTGLTKAEDPLFPALCGIFPVQDACCLLLLLLRTFFPNMQEENPYSPPTVQVPLCAPAGVPVPLLP